MGASVGPDSAIAAWHDGLTPELAAESWEWLTGQLERRGLFFGDRPLCTVLRPRFLSPGQYDLLRARVAVLLGAFDKALRGALANPRLLDQFRLRDDERALALEEPRTAPSPVSRLDAFFDPADGRLRITEYNAETPAGSAYNPRRPRPAPPPARSCPPPRPPFSSPPATAGSGSPNTTRRRRPARRTTTPSPSSSSASPRRARSSGATPSGPSRPRRTCSTPCSTRGGNGRAAGTPRSSASSTGRRCRPSANSSSTRSTSPGWECGRSSPTCATAR